MDFVKNQIQRIQQQLAGLTASQKMLTGALVAIMVMTLWFWGRLASSAESVPLLDQSFSQSDLGQIQVHLERKGIPYNNSGDRLLVPAERRIEALADLAYAKLLPRNIQTGFDQMAAKANPFASASERASIENRAKEITCGQLISHFPDVDEALVVIDPTRTRHVGNNIEPSATITIKMREGSAGIRQVADAAASVVMGAQAGLQAAKISVIVNGIRQRLRGLNDAGGPSGDDQLELKRKHEEEQEKRIRDLFDYVPDLRVAVSVRVNANEVQTREKKIDKDNTITKEVETETSETETNSGAPAAEPGVIPNVGGGANEPMSVAGGAGGGGGQNSRESTERSTYLVLPSETETITKSGPGEATVVSASVRVPRSYFVAALRGRTGDGTKTPAEQDVEAYATATMARMEVSVRNTTGMAEDARVAVDMFDDAAISLVSASMPPTATMSVPVMLGSHGKEIALGGLALVSMFMLMMMVKRSAPAPAIVAVAANPSGPPPQLVSGEMVAGEAGDGETLLHGMELDDDAVTTQQMLDQVSTMVKDNPDAAATLVKRWLNRD